MYIFNLDHRRFDVYFKINEYRDDKCTIRNLNTSSYVKFKCRKHGAFEIIMEYLKERYPQEIDSIEVIYSSIDDVDYLVAYPFQDENDGDGKSKTTVEDKVVCNESNNNLEKSNPDEIIDLENPEEEHNEIGQESSLQEKSDEIITSLREASDVWNHFEKLDDVLALCNYCKKSTSIAKIQQT